MTPGICLSTVLLGDKKALNDLQFEQITGNRPASLHPSLCQNAPSTTWRQRSSTKSSFHRSPSPILPSVIETPFADELIEIIELRIRFDFRPGFRFDAPMNVKPFTSEDTSRRRSEAANTTAPRYSRKAISHAASSFSVMPANFPWRPLPMSRFAAPTSLTQFSRVSLPWPFGP